MPPMGLCPCTNQLASSVLFWFCLGNERFSLLCFVLPYVVTVVLLRLMTLQKKTSELNNMNVFYNTKGIGITSLARSIIDGKPFFCIQYALGGEKLQR
jgi:hypothetical protein